MWKTKGKKKSKGKTVWVKIISKASPQFSKRKFQLTFLKKVNKAKFLDSLVFHVCCYSLSRTTLLEPRNIVLLHNFSTHSNTMQVRIGMKKTMITSALPSEKGNMKWYRSLQNWKNMTCQLEKFCNLENSKNKELRDKNAYHHIYDEKLKQQLLQCPLKHSCR